ncbi:hypothetical protein SLS58_005396 [Diplodia intermedia]|uniref:S-adenosyl-L-methionine-dependent methyltransferase n=1 Tax=Diplodia intermedia TaxID=856260 RepID=A0ABR3TR55_9PEZI
MSNATATDRFNAEAAAWDSNPVTVRSSELAYEALLRHVPALTDERSKQTLDILEIGCGTGLLSTRLSPHCRTLLGIDLAEGMVAAFNAKVASSPTTTTTNLSAITTLLTSPDQPEVQTAARALLSRAAPDARNAPPAPFRWSLIASHLTLHHVPDLRAFLTTLLAALAPGGAIALTDFEDCGRRSVLFHPREKREGVERHGIARGAMAALAGEVGFVDVEVGEAFVLEKGVDAGEAEEVGVEVEGGRMGFPFLVVVGRRRRAGE